MRIIMAALAVVLLSASTPASEQSSLWQVECGGHDPIYRGPCKGALDAIEDRNNHNNRQHNGRSVARIERCRIG